MSLYYHRTLRHSSGITHSVLGNFLDEKKEDIIVSTGRILKLLRFEPDSEPAIQTLISEDTYDNICSLSKFRRKDQTKDWIIFTTYGGTVIMFSVDASKMSFKLVLNEDIRIRQLSADSHGRAVFMESNLQDMSSRKIPGQHLAVGSGGYAFFIAALESLKQLWFFTDPDNDNVMEILDDSEENLLIYDITFVDLYSENIVIAYLATAYEELYAGIKYELRERRKPSLVFCEGNKDKLTEIKRIKCLDHANSLISVPGERGVLVCAEDYIAFYYAESSDIIRCPIPKRIMDPKDHVIFVCSTKYNEKDSIYYLAQTEQGDIFKIQLVINNFGVNEIILKYFITLPVASALCAFESGFLFVASEFGDHLFYKIADIENCTKCQPSFSSALHSPSFSDVLNLPKRNHFFFLHRTVNIEPVAKMESMSPIMQMELQSNRPQMCLTTGRASSSALKISTLEPDVSYQFRVKIEKERDEIPLRMWAIESTRSISENQLTLIIVSFESSTAVYSLVEAFVIEKMHGTLINADISTIGCEKTGEDAIVQIGAEGICFIANNVNNLIHQADDPSKAIQSYAINGRSLIVAIGNTLLKHHEIGENGHLKKAIIPCRLLNGPVTCMLLYNKSAKEELLAVGVSTLSSMTASSVESSASGNEIHLFIICVSEIKLLHILRWKQSPYSFSSFLFNNAQSDQELLLVGCEDGTLLTLFLSTINPSVIEQTIENRENEPKMFDSDKIGTESVELLYVPVMQNQWILAVSNQSWVKETAASKLIRLKSDLAHCMCILPERPDIAIGISTILEDSFRIFLFEDLHKKPPFTIPLEYTPKKFAIDSRTEHVFIIEADDNSHTAETREKKRKEFQQHVAANRSRQPASNLPPVEKVPKSWASIFRVFDLSEENAREVFKLHLKQNEAALSFCHVEVEDGNILLVGVAKGFNQSTACCKEASIYTYKMEFGKAISYLHKTIVKSAPLAMCCSGENVLIGIGRKLALYRWMPDSLELKLLCEKKECVSNSITGIYIGANRILVSDSKFGFSCLIYEENEESEERKFSLQLLDKDDASAEVTAACIFGEDKMVAQATKSRDISIVELGALETIDDEVTLSKEKLIACFHVGEVVTSLQPLVIFPNEPEAIVYTTLSGSVGILSLLPWEKDAKFLSYLNTAFEKTVKEIDKRRRNFKLAQYFQFRSRHYKCENVIDGDFLEQFDKLEVEHQMTIAKEMEEEDITQISARLENIRRETMLDFLFCDFLTPSF